MSVPVKENHDKVDIWGQNDCDIYMKDKVSEKDDIKSATVVKGVNNIRLLGLLRQ